MASNHDDSSFDDSSSSLGDSTYDFVDDKSAVVSEDEDRFTQSASSSEEREEAGLKDQSKPRRGSNNHSQQSQLSLNSLCSLFIDNSLPTESQPTLELPRLSHGSAKLGMITNDSRSTEKNDVHSIELDEPTIAGLATMKEVEGSRTLKIFQEHEISQMLHHIRIIAPPTQVTATIRQTMIAQGLVLGKSYKVLYIGDVSAKDAIIRKLGSALATSLGPERFCQSRFNVVPISSFGDVRSPEVILIDSTGLEMTVEECRSASFTKRDCGNGSIKMTLSNQSVIESSSSEYGYFVINDWSLPDVAVFYLAEDDDICAKQTRHFARKLMHRHGIPCIFISQAPLWNRHAEIIALDRRTPHVCLEAHCSDSTKFQIIKRLPIDLGTFLKIDAGQMNRGLAYLATTRIIKVRASNEPSKNFEARRALLAPDESDTLLSHFPYFNESRMMKKAPFVKQILTSGFFLVLGLLIYHLTTFSVLVNPQVSISRETPINEGGSAVVLVRPTNTVSILPRNSPASISSSTPTLMNQLSATKIKAALQAKTDITSFLVDRETLKPNKSEKFYVKIVGDCHIVLRAPQWFTNIKKTPKVTFRVSRAGSVLNPQVSTLFNGIYALEIPREDAYGTLNVSISSITKPRVNETFEVYLRPSWFQGFALRRIAEAVIGSIHSDLRNTQTGLVLAYDCTSAKLESFLYSILDKAEGLRDEANGICLASLNQIAQVKDILSAQALDLPRILFGKLKRKNTTISGQDLSNATHIFDGFMRYTSRKSISFSRHTSQLSQVASKKMQVLKVDFIDSRKKHLRETQKMSLKLWWKIKGLPKTPPMKIRAFRNSQQRYTGCTNKISR